MWVWNILLLVFIVGGSGEPVTRFSNIYCEVLDPTFCSFKECELKVLGRGIVGINFNAVIVRGYFDNAKINLSLWRKYNGFHPFMFNKTFDFCAFMSKKSKALSFEKIVFDAINASSNINHSCPYRHNLILRNVPFKEDFLKYLPMPSGEYKLEIIAATDKKWVGKVSLYILRKEDLLQS